MNKADSLLWYDYMAEFWYDTLEGSLVVGRAAFEQSIEQQYPGQMQPLAEVLTAPNFPYRLGDFEPMATRRAWSRDEKMQLGQWAVKVLETISDQPPLLRQEHVDRLHILGLSPTYAAFREFGHINSLREAIGSALNEYGHTGIYVNWSIQDYVSYARTVQARLGRKPSHTDYASSDGPPYHLISSRLGGTRKLNEYLGYPNIHDWHDNDYVSWGIDVIKMNGDDCFSPNLIRLISKQQLGPSVPTIRRHFKKWSIFKKQVLEQYHRLPDEHDKQQSLLETFQKLHAQELLPDGIDATDIPSIKHAGARYLVIDDCLPGLDPAQQKRLMSVPVNAFIKELRRHKPELSAGHIEIVAVTHDVLDLIWPIDDTISRLRVDSEELKRMHDHQRATNTRSRAKAKKKPHMV